MAKAIHTIKGHVEIDSLGLILPHEHLITDLRGPRVPDYAQGEASAVASIVEPYLAEASAAGVTASVRADHGQWTIDNDPGSVSGVCSCVCGDLEA